ncbi:MAG: hypothetical protein IH600_15025 [Bacteroidetes bacterium]|nr:hypothetical protein [Bacteroidota bacterium]
MVTLLDPKWAVLQYHIAAGDKLGLTLINPAHFTGTARAVYDLAIEQPELSMPVILQAMKAGLDDQSLEVAVEELMRHHIKAEEVDHYRRALVASYNNWKIKDAIDWAAEQIGTGQNRMRILEELYSRLSNVHDIRGLLTFEDVFEQIAQMNVPTIPTGFAAFREAGLSEYQTGNMMLLAGDTGTFKTTTAINMCRASLYEDPDLHVFYFMKEQRFHEVWYKLFAMESDMSYSDIQRMMNMQHPQARDRIRASFSPDAYSMFERFHVISQDTFSTPQDVASMLRGYSTRYAKMMWVVDYATRLDFGGRPEHFNAYYAAGLEVLKNATLATQSFGIVVTQLKDNWNIDYKTGNKIKTPPDRKDIIWSSEAKNLAAYILMLYNPGTYFDVPKNYLYLSVLKVRHVEKVSRINMLVNGEKQLVEPADAMVSKEMETILKNLQKER